MSFNFCTEQYGPVPTTWPSCNGSMESLTSVRAIPKSVSKALPSSSSRMLAGLRS